MNSKGVIDSWLATYDSQVSVVTLLEPNKLTMAIEFQSPADPEGPATGTFPLAFMMSLED